MTIFRMAVLDGETFCHHPKKILLKNLASNFLGFKHLLETT